MSLSFFFYYLPLLLSKLHSKRPGFFLYIHSLPRSCIPAAAGEVCQRLQSGTCPAGSRPNASVPSSLPGGFRSSPGLCWLGWEGPRAAGPGSALPSVSALWDNSVKTLPPALSAGLGSQRAVLSSALSCTALSPILSLPNTYTQRTRSQSLPFCTNDTSCHERIWNMVSLKPSLKLRLTPLKLIITQSYCWEKKISMFQIPDDSWNWAYQNGPHTACAWSFLFGDRFPHNRCQGHTGCWKALPS